MPDGDSNETIKQEAVQHRPEAETIPTPTPPNNPISPPAQTVTDKRVETAVQAIEDRVKRAEWLMIGLTAGIVVLTLGLVIVGVLQWRVMSGQLGEMKSGGVDTGHLVEAAKKQAAANVQQVGNFASLAIAAKSESDNTATIAKAAGEANTIARETLESVQRAFIAYHSIECIRGKNGDRIYWNIQPVYENSGNTPALNAVNAWTVAQGRAAIPEEMFKLGKPGTIPTKLISASIAPKASQHAAPIPLDESYIFGIDLGDRFENFTKSHNRDDLTVFGWMVYHDTMPKTKPRLTEFCMRFDTPGLVDETPTKLKFNFANCQEHNCTDEYCPDYSEIVAFAKSRGAN